MVWITADSSVVDLTTNNDGLSKCNARPTSAAERAAGDNGEFHCQNKDAAGTMTDAPAGSTTEAQKLDLNQNYVFKNIRFRRQRIMAGLAFRYEIAQILLHFMTDIADPEAGGDERIKGLAKQWTLAMSTGISW